ncbi:hypothetical protein L1889_10800 [Paenalcaligenes niemegkensis]|uniref:hypothetical protein n=1 Tax=Paenalcaligenes niemegkensis TaxID=2895469 RepID=UPI001EE9A5EF|nr:hypothetical protein [Paenalcaligenes niemegkensis]MCQ9617125.1 hypothetical protein [Paenalcaligenes niemegkensis]
MSQTPKSPFVFTDDELDTLARTADALSAYLGKPVLAEVVDASETGFEWVIFAIPLDVNDDDTTITVVQIGGAKARLLGSQGGLNIGVNESYSCQYLWAIQLSDTENIRYIKLDDQGDDVAWSDSLEDILPFQIDSDVLADDDEADVDKYEPVQIPTDFKPGSIH